MKQLVPFVFGFALAVGPEWAEAAAYGSESSYLNVPFQIQGLPRDFRHYPYAVDWEKLEIEPIDWDAPDVEDIGPGTKLVCYKTDATSPAPLDNTNKYYILRIDIAQPGLRITGPGRAALWGQPMTDTDTPATIGTVREKSTDFMARSRAPKNENGRNLDMFLVLNSCGWSPWGTDGDARSYYGNPATPYYADGIHVSQSPYGKVTSGGIFVWYKDNTADIIGEVNEENAGLIFTCYPATSWWLVRDGEIVKSTNTSRAQRMSYGLSQDRRTMYVVLSDGRDDVWSVGATPNELAVLHKAAGSWIAQNQDGGGSTTCAYWNEAGAEKEKIVLVNCPNYTTKPGGKIDLRRNGCNAGFYLFSVLAGVNDYRDMDAFFASEDASTDIQVVRDTTLTAASAFPRSCTVRSPYRATFGWGASLEPTVKAGTRVFFSNVVFAASSPVLRVARGGVAAIAEGDFGRLATADANGFELAGPLTEDLVVDCTSANAEGEIFGVSSLSLAAAAASAGHLRHPTNPLLGAVAVELAAADRADPACGVAFRWRRLVDFEQTATVTGYDFSNAVVKVRVDMPASVDATHKVRMTLLSSTGATLATVEKPCEGPGEYAFDVAADTPSCDYRIEIVDADGVRLAHSEPRTGSVALSNVEPWFAAAADGDTAAGGAWETKPAVSDGQFVVTGGAEPAFAAAKGQNGHLLYETRGVFLGGMSVQELDTRKAACQAGGAHGALSLAEDPASGGSVWAALVKEQDAATWKFLQGPLPVPGRTYSLAMEVDLGAAAPRVCYSVTAPGGVKTRLSDADGNVWFDGIGPASGAAGRVGYAGEMSVTSLKGEYLDRSVAEADGTRYATVAEALASATGGAVKLLTNATLTPTVAGDWTVTADGYDLRVNVPAAWTVEYRDGRLVVTARTSEGIPLAGEGGVRATVGDDFLAKWFPGKSLAADFEEIREGLNAPRTTGNRLTLLQSYILGLDPDDPDDTPKADFAWDAGQNAFVVRLVPDITVNEAANVKVTYSMARADDVRFEQNRSETTPSNETTFTATKDETKPAAFFRVNIHFSNK